MCDDDDCFISVCVCVCSSNEVISSMWPEGKQLVTEVSAENITPPSPPSTSLSLSLSVSPSLYLLKKICLVIGSKYMGMWKVAYLELILDCGAGIQSGNEACGSTTGSSELKMLQ